MCVDICVQRQNTDGVCVDICGPCYHAVGEACKSCVLEVEGYAEQGPAGPLLALALTGLCSERAGPATHPIGELVSPFTSAGRAGITPHVVQHLGEQVPPLSMDTGELSPDNMGTAEAQTDQLIHLLLRPTSSALSCPPQHLPHLLPPGVSEGTGPVDP